MKIETGAEFLKFIVKLETLQSTLNDPKPNSRDQASKLPYI